MLRLQDYAPDADLTTITQAQAQTALAITYGGESESEKAERVQAILTDVTMIDAMAAEITAGQLNQIQAYAPDVDVSVLTEQDVDLIMTFIYSDMSRGEKLGKIYSILNS
jgi:hypothetical protein